MATVSLNSATLTPKLLFSNLINTTTGIGSAVYTVPTGRCARIYSLSLCNVNTASVVVDIYVVPSGASSPGAERKIISQLSIAQDDSIALKEYFGGLSLGEGDAIWVKVGANNINVILSGVEGAA